MNKKIILFTILSKIFMFSEQSVIRFYFVIMTKIMVNCYTVWKVQLYVTDGASKTVSKVFESLKNMSDNGKKIVIQRKV